SQVRIRWPDRVLFDARLGGVVEGLLTRTPRVTARDQAVARTASVVEGPAALVGVASAEGAGHTEAELADRERKSPPEGTRLLDVLAVDASKAGDEPVEFGRDGVDEPLPSLLHD